MIQTIGIMIACYIITRMVEIIVNKQTHGAVALCAFVTIVGSIIGILMLIISGNNIASLINKMQLHL